MVTLRPRFSSNRPREAQIIPFPSEDVTPPVTNTYLVCTDPEGYWGEPGTSWTALFIREDDSAAKIGARRFERGARPKYNLHGRCATTVSPVPVSFFSEMSKAFKIRALGRMIK